MKKIITIITLMMALCTATFAKEYTWGTKTQWANTNPEVVATMPGVVEFCKSFGVTNPKFETFNNEDNYWYAGVVCAVYDYFNKSRTPDKGQFMYYNDELNLFIIFNYIDGKFTNAFIASLQ